MTQTMPIVLTDPISVPAKTYNIVWIKSIFIDGTNTANVTANYELRPALVNEDGSYDVATSGVKGRIDNLFMVAAARAVAGKPKLAVAVQAVMSALEELEKEKGTI